MDIRVFESYYTYVLVLMGTSGERKMAAGSVTDTNKSRPPLVSVVTVNWNGVDDTIECVLSLQRQTYPNFDITVVDNGSDGDDPSILESLFGTSISVVRNTTNLGCGGGYNSGVRRVLRHEAPDYVLIMNNDMVADSHMVEELVNAASADEDIGIVGAKVYYYDCGGRSDIVWSAGGEIRRWGSKIHRRRGDGKMDATEYQSVRRVDWVSGAALLFRPQVITQAGSFNARHMVGYEDIQFCLRASAAGYGVLFAPSARAWHKVGASASKLHINSTNPSAYYELVRECFPRHVYVYHLSLFPLLLCKWALLYVLRSRDREALRRFLRDLRVFVLRRRTDTAADESRP